jgi:hypothetical protein
MLWPKRQLQTMVCATKQIPCKVLQAVESMNCWLGHPLGQSSNGDLTVWKIRSNVEQRTYCRPVNASLLSIKFMCDIVGIKFRMGWCLLWLKVPPHIQQIQNMFNMFGVALNQHVELIHEKVPSFQKGDLITWSLHHLNGNFVLALQSGSQNITEKLLSAQAKNVIHV